MIEIRFEPLHDGTFAKHGCIQVIAALRRELGMELSEAKQATIAGLVSCKTEDQAEAIRLVLRSCTDALK